MWTVAVWIMWQGKGSYISLVLEKEAVTFTECMHNSAVRVH